MAESHSPLSVKCRVEQVKQQHIPQAYTHRYTLEKTASLTLTGMTKSGLALPKVPRKLWLKQANTVGDGDPVILSGPTNYFAVSFQELKAHQVHLKDFIKVLEQVAMFAKCS